MAPYSYGSYSWALYSYGPCNHGAQRRPMRRTAGSASARAAAPSSACTRRRWRRRRRSSPPCVWTCVWTCYKSKQGHVGYTSSAMPPLTRLLSFWSLHGVMDTLPSLAKLVETILRCSGQISRCNVTIVMLITIHSLCQPLSSVLLLSLLIY